LRGIEGRLDPLGERAAGPTHDPAPDGGPEGGQDGGHRRPGADVVGAQPLTLGHLGRDQVLQPAHDHGPVVLEQRCVLLGHLGDQALPAGVGSEVAGHVPEHAEQRLVGGLVGRPGPERLHRGLDLRLGVVEEHGLLGREVAEERPPAHVGPLGDLVDGGVGEALLPEEAEGRLDDRRPGAVHVAFPKAGHGDHDRGGGTDAFLALVSETSQVPGARCR
jgi:hypothetical protein